MRCPYSTSATTTTHQSQEASSARRSKDEITLDFTTLVDLTKLTLCGWTIDALDTVK